MIYNALSPATTNPAWLKLGFLKLGISLIHPTAIGRGTKTVGAWLNVGFDLCTMKSAAGIHLWLGPKILGFGFHLHLHLRS